MTVDELREKEWDRQMQRDFSPDGPGAYLLEKVEKHIAAGNFSSLEERLRRRREQRAKD